MTKMSKLDLKPSDRQLIAAQETREAILLANEGCMTTARELIVRRLLRK